MTAAMLDGAIFAGHGWLEVLQAKSTPVQVACVILLLLTVFLGCNLLLNATRFHKRLMLVDLHCFKVPEHLKISHMQMMDIARKRGCYSQDSLDFMTSLLQRNGVGDATGLPQVCFELADPARQITLKDSMQELEMIMYETVDNLLNKAGIAPHEIGIVITACSCFAPTPSMAAMLVNHFKLRRNVLTYSLAGMGCSASLVCVDMAKHLLKALPNTVCLVFNHENVTSNIYPGNTRALMMCNTLFRIGGAAILLSNRPRDQKKAKYDLRVSLRTHMGGDDEAFACMGSGEDENGVPGIFLRKTIIGVTGRAMVQAVTALAPHALPYTELIRCALNKAYRPSFRHVFDHYMFHIGGKGVLDSLQQALDLTDKDMQSANETLDRFGNMSAASTWYILANIERQGVRQGDKLWQLGIGGGFKANSAIWRARRNILEAHDCWT